MRHMPTELKVTVYQYDELTDTAKEKARNWFREKCVGSEDLEHVIEDAEQIAGFLGISIKNIWWRGFNSQGDGACFEGRWNASDVKPSAELIAHAPQDLELHRLAKEFEKVAKNYPHAHFTTTHNGHYYHKRSVDFDAQLFSQESDEVYTPQDHGSEQELIELGRDFMQWIYDRLEEENDYRNSDETVADDIRGNEYTFTADGKRFLTA